MAFRCPSCQEPDSLYEMVMVEGWRSVDASLKETGRSSGDRDVEWSSVEASGNYGCSCGWGPKYKTFLEEIGIDGEPLPAIHRNQLSLTTAGPESRSERSPNAT